jgi:hypothetical protein
MADPITLSSNEVYLTGRVAAPKVEQDRVGVAARLDFRSSNTFVVDFTVTNQAQVIGTVRTMFMDNTTNPNEVIVSVGGTNQSFTIPANAEGYFPLTATEISRITMTSLGGATSIQSAVFYNYDMPAVVWYKYGLNPTDGIQRVQGTQPVGTNMNTAPNNSPVYMAGVQSNGSLTPLLVTSTGSVSVSFAANSEVIVNGRDVEGATQSGNPVRIAGSDSSNNVHTLLTGNSGGIVLGQVGTTATSTLAVYSSDNSATNIPGLIVVARGQLFNGTACERTYTVTGANNTPGTGTQAVGMPLWSTSDLTPARISVNTSGDNTLVAAVAGQTTRVYAIRFIAKGAVDVSIKNGAGTILEVFPLQTGGAINLDLRDRPYYKTSANTALIIGLSAAVQVEGLVEYVRSV